MSDQSRVDKLIEQYLRIWSVFLAACGRFWENVKAWTEKTVAFLRRCADWIADTVGKGCDVVAFHARKVLRKAAVWLLKVRGWCLAKWNRYAKPVLRKIAAWLLVVREKLDPGIAKVKGWGNTLKEKARKAFPARPEALPPAEEAAEPVPAAVEEVSAEAPAVEEAVSVTEAPAEPEPLSARISDPTLAKIVAVLGTIGRYVKLVLKWIWKLRTVFMAIPVVWAAVKLALQNLDRLPDYVGLDIQSSGEFARMITKTEAVLWPLGITAFCLVLMFCSKKPLLPWVISIFTLVLPVLIWVLNFYA